jgi:hypothetical protein
VRPRDRERITSRDGRSLTGSIDLDKAMRLAHPDAARWDYGIGIRRNGEHVVWVEIHPASSSHIEAVLRKLQWLRGWLKTNAPELRGLSATFAWVASGAVALPRTSPQRRRVANAGIHFAGERIEVDRHVGAGVIESKASRKRR